MDQILKFLAFVSETVRSMETKDIITFLIALYGAGLATYREIADYLARRRRIEVKLQQGLIGTKPKLTDTLVLTAINTGSRPHYSHIVNSTSTKP